MAHPLLARRLTLLASSVLMAQAQLASASMGNIGSTYGVLPTDLASAQALSMFNPHVSATFYNPAYLTTDTRGELSTAILHAEPDLTARSLGGNGTFALRSESQHVLIGMKTEVSDLLRHGPPVYLGFVVGVEKYGQEMLAFDSRTSEQGQFLHYGRQPMFLSIGGASPLWRGLSAGISARVTLHAASGLSAVSDLAGNTQEEQIAVNAEPSIRMIYSANLDWGKTFCPDRQCLVSGWETAVTYRTSSDTNTSVEAKVVIPGLIPASDPLEMRVRTFDSYQPATLAVGVQYRAERWRAGLTVEQQYWSKLSEKLEGDSIKNQAQVGFEDILIPRLGAEYWLTRNFSVTTGVAWQPSPLKDGLTPDVNYFDNERYIVGIGLSAQFERTRFLTYPVRLDVGYQHHLMVEREFDLSRIDPDGQVEVYDRVTTEGQVGVLAGSLTFKF